MVGLCVPLVTTNVLAQTANATANSSSKPPKQALAESTTPVKDPVAGKVAAAAVPGTTPAPAVGKASAMPMPGLAPMPAATGTVNQGAATGLGPDVIWVPERAGPSLRRKVTGGEKSVKTTAIRQSGPPVSTLQVDKEPRREEIDDRKIPRVWCVPAGEHISPINGNLLRDGHLGYENGGLMLGHRISNEIWNVRGNTVQVACNKNWVAGFQLITELKGKQRRIQILAENLDGPRILPANPCIKVSRLWYVRGKNGREVDGYWDEPLTLIPLLKPLNVPPPDNNVVGQTNQAFHVSIHIPRQVFPGTYRTTLHVRDLDDPLYEENIHVEVTARPTGARR
jgi:hypothetical protein